MAQDFSPIEQAISLLSQGDVIGLPTETVYGLAADATNVAAVARIFQIKGRPSDHPLILHLGDASWLDDWASEVPERARLLAEKFWPGPLTLVLEKSARVSDAVTGGLQTVALRVPGHPVALELLRSFGRPLAAPSANRFGSVSPTTRQHVLDDLGDDIELVLEGGPCAVGLESTIVDLSGAAPRLLRPGGISLEELESALGERVLPSDGSVRAPGTLESHYAPRAPVHLVTPEEIWVRALTEAAAGTVGVLTDVEPPVALPDSIALALLGHDAGTQAHELYACLRTLDERGVRIILSTLPSEVGLGAAVVDRLRRASAPR